MKAILPDAMFIGFTGTPLLKADKREHRGLRPATSTPTSSTRRCATAWCSTCATRPATSTRASRRRQKIDQWFEAKTKGLTDLAKAQLKQRWGTMQKVLSSQRPGWRRSSPTSCSTWRPATALMSGHGNAMLVSSASTQACKFYELFQKTDLKGKCAIVTSYKPNDRPTSRARRPARADREAAQVRHLPQMLADYFNEPKTGDVEGRAVREGGEEAFIESPAR
jgi:type I restriction enzyme, R subunit